MRDPSKRSLRLRLCVLHVLSLLPLVIPLLLSQPPPLIRILSLLFPPRTFLPPVRVRRGRAQRGSRRRRRRRRRKETDGGKMKSAPHGASGGALWNAASEGRMKALVTSHHTKVHMHTLSHARTHIHTQPSCGATETHSPAEPCFEKKKVQRE